jgi:hypothetical protein
VSKAYVLPKYRGLGLLSFIATFDTLAAAPSITITYKPIIVLVWPDDPRSELTVTTEYIVPLGNDDAAIGTKTAYIYENDVDPVAFSAITVVDGSYLCTMDFEDVPFEGVLMGVAEGSATGTGNVTITFLSI